MVCRIIASRAASMAAWSTPHPSFDRFGPG
jgi:hypothetical protein